MERELLQIRCVLAYIGHLYQQHNVFSIFLDDFLLGPVGLAQPAVDLGYREAAVIVPAEEFAVTDRLLRAGLVRLSYFLTMGAVDHLFHLCLDEQLVFLGAS